MDINSGFGMAGAQYVFLERNMEIDKISFDQAIEYYKGMDRNYQVRKISILFSMWMTNLSFSYSPKERISPLGPRSKARNTRKRMD